jgi:hypothetical protein
MVLTSKYDIGDVVYSVQVESVDVRHTCPECLGAKEWTITTPAGNSVTVECPTCSYGYTVRGFIIKSQINPIPCRLTIGQVRYESGFDGEGMMFKYMCDETGIGSGTIWKESELFSTEAEAIAYGVIKAAERQAFVDGEEAKVSARNLKEFKRLKKCLVCGGSGRVSL